jgi:hypothetical protein
MVRKEVMAVTPKWKDAQIEMGDHQPFIRLKNDRKGEFFLPTDLALAPDGSLFLSDFYNDTSRGTNQVSGSIYRITRKDQKPLVLPKVNFSSISGLLQALKNPAVNVRSHAAHLLVKKGKEVFDHVHEFLRETTGEPVLQARALWVLAQIGNHEVVKDFLDNEENEKLQVVAYRALRLADPTGTLARAKEYADSKNLFLRREIAVSLRCIAFEDCSSILESLVDGYDGRNRYYLEALGAAFHGREKRVYNEIVTKRSSDPSGWDWKAKNLAWRLHTPEAIRDLDQCIRAQKPPVDEFRFLAMAFASFRTDEERKDRVDRLRALAQLPEFSADYYQVTVDEIIEKDLNDLEGEMMETSYLIPQQLGQITEVSKPEKLLS